MTIVQKHDPKVVRARLQSWVTSQLPDASDVTVSEVSTPGVGRSVEQYIFTAAWMQEGERVERDLVARLEPEPTYQVFPDTNFRRQYDVLGAVHATGRAPVPEPWAFEDDSSVLGQRFYVMGKLPGGPGEHDQQWIKDLSHSDHREMCLNSLKAMGSLHAIDPRDLDLPDIGQYATPEEVMRRQLEDTRAFYDSVRDGKSYPATEALFEWLPANMPADLGLSVQWGDARMGNMLFERDLRCTGILDWEAVEIGFAEADLGWWWWTDKPTSPSRAAVSSSDHPDRVPTEEEVRSLYSDAIGRPVSSLGYWELFAMVRIAPIMLKLDILYREYGVGWPGGNYVEPFIAERLGM